MNETNSILICPVCSNPLLAQDRSYACLNKHMFDKSKQGYVNLLLSNQKKSLQPGDNKEMVKSRLDFLQRGYYLPIVEVLKTTIENTIEQQSSHDLQIADLGCGVGYYLSCLTRHFNSIYPNLSYWGIDISKEAIQQASVHDKSISWLVGSTKKLPFASGSIDILLSIFSPFYTEEVKRVLSPKGAIFVITPGTNHLIELRKTLFDEIKPIDATKLLQKSEGIFELVNSIPICSSAHLQSQDDIENLLKMTPFYWRSSGIKKTALLSQESLTVTIDVTLWVFK